MEGRQRERREEGCGQETGKSHGRRRGLPTRREHGLRTWGQVQDPLRAEAPGKGELRSSPWDMSGLRSAERRSPDEAGADVGVR